MTEPIHHDPHYTRGDKQYETMLSKLADEECGLCTLSVHPKPILARACEGTDHEWIITERFEIPENVEHYWLILPTRHIENQFQLTLGDYEAIHRLVTWATEEFNLDGFGLTLRSGNTKRTGATCKHIHWPMIVPKIDKETGRAIPYYFPIG